MRKPGGSRLKKRRDRGGTTGRAGWASGAGHWEPRRRWAAPLIRRWSQRRDGMCGKDKSWSTEHAENQGRLKARLQTLTFFTPSPWIAPQDFDAAFVTGENPAQDKQQV